MRRTPSVNDRDSEKLIMHIEVKDAQVNPWPNGSAEVLGSEGYLLFKGKYAEQVKNACDEWHKGNAREGTLSIIVEIEVTRGAAARVEQKP